MPAPVPILGGSPTGNSPLNLVPPVSTQAGSLASPSTAIHGVCVAFDSATLEESPLWTRLDDPAGPFIVSSYSIDRGRTYELDQNGAGTASVTLIDLAGNFDPTNASGPFYGKLLPMKQAAIALRSPVTGNWRTIFRGFISRWNYDLYQTENYNTITLELVDGTEVLSNAQMTLSVAASGGIWGDNPPSTVDGGNIYYNATNQVNSRIDQVLSNAGWPTGLREIFSGNVKVKATVYSPRTAALAAIQDAADAEFPEVSNFYFDKEGNAVFHGRQARFRPDVAEYHISTWYAGDQAACLIDPDRALIFGLEWELDGGKIYNEALATPQGINDDDIELQYVEDGDSIDTYGRRTISFENLLTDGGYIGGTSDREECLKFATYYVDNFAQPYPRVNSITFKRVGTADLGASELWSLIHNIDISDIISLTTTHGGGGGFNEDFYVEGLHYTVEPLNDQYLDVELKVDVSPRAFYDTNPFA